jgi:hypothetical protein
MTKLTKRKNHQTASMRRILNVMRGNVRRDMIHDVKDVAREGSSRSGSDDKLSKAIRREIFRTWHGVKGIRRQASSPRM